MGGHHTGACVRHEVARFSWPATIDGGSTLAFWQALLANMAAMYAVYHGPEGLKTIANRVHGLAAVFSAGVSKLGLQTGSAPFFDTVKVTVGEGQAEKITKDATAHGVNLRVYDSKSVSYIPVAAVSLLNFWIANECMCRHPRLPRQCFVLQLGLLPSVSPLAVTHAGH